MNDRDFLSIGEVLAQLLEEFPDVTISKIRFLESQGLIEPERTPSGYRKFTAEEVDRLRFILREQRTNYLPLRIIKDKLDDDTSDISRDISRDIMMPMEYVASSGHPATRTSVPRPREVSGVISTPHRDQDPMLPESDRRLQRQHALQHVDKTESIPRDQLLSQFAIDSALLKELESVGLISGHEVGDTTFFDASSIAIAKAAARFQELGIDVRHLRGWKTSADREVSLFEQRILPYLRQRNPVARDEALQMLSEFMQLGGDLRSGLIQRDIIRLTEQR